MTRKGTNLELGPVMKSFGEKSDSKSHSLGWTRLETNMHREIKETR